MQHDQEPGRGQPEAVPFDLPELLRDGQAAAEEWARVHDHSEDDGHRVAPLPRDRARGVRGQASQFPGPRAHRYK